MKAKEGNGWNIELKTGGIWRKDSVVWEMTCKSLSFQNIPDDGWRMNCLKQQVCEEEVRFK